MSAFRRLFNTTRIPNKSIDQLYCAFKTGVDINRNRCPILILPIVILTCFSEDEGECPTNIIIVKKGYFFSFDVVGTNNNILKPPEIEKQLYYIDKWCNQNSKSDEIGVLTSTNRDKWTENRNYLQQLNIENETSLKLIDQSIMIVLFEDLTPQSKQEVK